MYQVPIIQLSDGRVIPGYPEGLINDCGRLHVSAKHEIYWEERGNPEGEPVFFVHGGPGGFCTPQDARFFNPERYRIIFFDQRGCDRSIPSAAKHGHVALEDNVTKELVSDIVKLREHLDITSKIHLFGGSWGASLIMPFSRQYPELVQSRVLRGIFAGGRQDLHNICQGRTLGNEPNDYVLEAWQRFESIIPEEKRGNMIEAYNDIFNNEAISLEDKMDAGGRWCAFESAISTSNPQPVDFSEFTHEKMLGMARIEAHYFANNLFLDEGELFADLHLTASIPTYIVHGICDKVCPREHAKALVDAITAVGGKVSYITKFTGHSAFERANFEALLEVMDTMPLMDGFQKSRPHSQKSPGKRFDLAVR
jgi:proline iminopeptidase